MNDGISLMVVVPSGNGECDEYTLEARHSDTGDRLKCQIQKLCGVDSEDQELFFSNRNPDTNQKWLAEERTLAQQDVRDGAVIMVGVHGQGSNVPDEADAPTTAVDHSLHCRGDASYYFAHARPSDIPAECRIVSGGSPQKIESAGPAVASAQPVQVDEQCIPERPERRIMNYSWGDEREVIKVYISKDSEADVIAAVGDGTRGQVEVDWHNRSLRLCIRAGLYDYVLALDRIYYDIVPEKCKWRVSAGKRVTLTLHKSEATTWLKLLKPD